MQSLVKLDGPLFGNIGVECFSQGHNDTLPSSKPEPRALHFREPCPTCVFRKDTTARYMLGVGIHLANLRLLFGDLTD